jgi:hypothetical protein
LFILFYTRLYSLHSFFAQSLSISMTSPYETYPVQLNQSSSSVENPSTRKWDASEPPKLQNGFVRSLKLLLEQPLSLRLRRTIYVASGLIIMVLWVVLVIVVGNASRKLENTNTLKDARSKFQSDKDTPMDELVSLVSGRGPDVYTMFILCRCS